MKNKEIWKDIPGYEGLYQASRSGKIRSMSRRLDYRTGSRMIDGRILRPALSKEGYLRVCLCREGEEKNGKVHRLICLTFLPNPENKPHVNHKDGNKLNNHVDNLEWCTASYNQRHAFAKGLAKPNYSGRKIDYETAEIIRKRCANGETKSVLGKEFGLSKGHIWFIVSGFCWNKKPEHLTPKTPGNEK